ncbi:cellulose binding domain-containing protein [Micromonospora lupini]|uniref:cellulose binding domain-containing protein n=1 Tax=Micromonospora lupini TaxID=285679 RepID=UPI002250D309|nr:cellulose binding domain-containing protein [Micromonospora lupini]MCX5070144.1 cellulose binding domain-containing protein [Micromonospora lupini]
MIEIGAYVDLSHPPDRVWLALTDRELLGRWFAEADMVEGVPDRLLLHTAGLPGFDADVEVEVTERRVPELLSLRCDEAGRLTELTCAVAATKQGSRLTVREVPTHGSWSEEQHESREQQLRQALTVRLPAILDWLAFQQVDLRRGEAGMTTELPVLGAAGPARARRRRRAAVAGLAAVVLVAGLVAWLTLSGEPGPSAAAPSPSPTPTTQSPSMAAAAPTAAPKATPSARPSRSATPTTTARPSRTPSAKPSRTSTAAPPPPPSPLAARYDTDSSRLFGYTGEVVVDNPGTAPADQWVVVVTLAEGSSVDDVEGADWRQDGQAITFSGLAVPAGGTRTIRFDVRDSRPKAREPEGCTVGGNPCAGL